MSSGPEATPSPVQFDRIGQIALTVTDIARAKDFYQNTLGMTFLFAAGELAFLQCGQIRLMLGTSEKDKPRGGTILYFNVDDIHASYTALKDRGVEFIDKPHLIAKMPDHDLWMVFFKDPDGNTLGVMCEMPSA
jgi:methylmalonyl-CoA/ethylmalonyl-CoA epimerase